VLGWLPRAMVRFARLFANTGREIFILSSMSDGIHHTCATALPGGPARALFCHRHVADYLPGAPGVLLRVAAERDAQGGLRIALSPMTEGRSGTSPAECDVDAFARQHGVPVVELGAPLRLDPVAIPKPWGRELWFTGIEARGQAGVRADGGSAPLPWLLSVAAGEILGNGFNSLNLLKILDPFPDPVYGDLYFELHQEKREVYVVTRVDPASWPAGRGAIRYGFDPRVRAAYPDEQAFRSAYLHSVRAYEQVRREIDRREDAWRSAEGYGPKDPVPVPTLRRWRAAHPPRLRRAEVEARGAMERFTQLLPVAVGDVIEVPTHLPHALQHGVRTVEFQTPVYERRILSFAQKVLTQDHWDTAAAVQQMRLEPPARPRTRAVVEGPGATRERIVAFDDFLVDRWQLLPGSRSVLSRQDSYALAMAVEGEITVAGVTLAAESALLIPAVCGAVAIANRGSEAASLLVARPRRQE